VAILVGTCFRPLSDKQVEKARAKGLDKWPDEVAQVFKNGLVLNEGVPLFHGDPLWFIWHYLHIKPNLFPPGTSTAWVFECGKPTWEAYTHIIAKATVMNAKYLMVIEDDVFVPQETVHRLFRYLEEHPECGAAGGLYAWRHQPDHGEFFQMYKDGMPIVNIPDNDVVDVDAAGLGCLMLRMDAVTKAKEFGRLFDDPWDAGDGMTAAGGDLCLQHRIKQAGYTIVVDTGIKAWHRDPYTGVFYPQERRAQHGYPAKPMVDFCQPTLDEALAGVLENAAIKGPSPSPHVEHDVEVDGRHIADIPSVPGAMAYGDTPEEAEVAARKIADEVTGAPDWDEIQEQNTRQNIMEIDGPVALNVGWGGTPAREKIHEQYAQWVNHDGHDSEGTHLVSDCRDINAPSGSFDFVYVNHVLEHLTDAEGVTALQEWWRLVKKGGRLFVGVPEMMAVTDTARRLGLHAPIYYLSDGTAVTPHLMLYGHPVGGAMTHKTIYEERELRAKFRELFGVTDRQIASQPDELIPCGVKFIVQKE
jgi:predicted SAM-dependent methyltransferase/predicted RNase H-like HicB family nuclease